MILLGLAIATALLPTNASEQASAAAWRELASVDVAAAIELIENSHPGAANELGDLEFQALLKRARDNATGRLPHVASYYDHAAVLNGLANDFRDGHIWSRARLTSATRRWAGLVSERRGGKWYISYQEPEESGGSLVGAEIISCDDMSAEQLGLARTGTLHANPEVEASMASVGYTLLLDDQTSLVHRPSQCQFRLGNGELKTASLRWRDISTRELTEKITKALRPAAAGMGVKNYGESIWISLESLDNRAAEVVAEVKAREKEIRSSPTVVIDLRGNSGGNSQFASEIVSTIVGTDRVIAAEPPASGCEGNYWKVSEGNVDALEAFAAQVPTDRREMWNRQLNDMKKARASGMSFSPSLPACASGSGTSRQSHEPKLPPSMQEGRLVFITDRSCFSSCLLAVDLLRRIGAIHVGEATDRSTRFMEVREIVLPSGLRTFSTLQKLALGAGNFGPYAPMHVFSGHMADTDALRAWIDNHIAR